MRRYLSEDPDVIRRGPLAGLRWTPRGRALVEGATLVAVSVSGAAGLLAFINVLPALLTH